ncbi:MAG: helix-turn-helix domain-containing protein [Alphaproteobacteria bacterium]
MVNQTPLLQGKEDLLKNLFDSGMTIEKIATELDVSMTSVFEKVRSLNLSRPLKIKTKLENKKEEVIELLESGVSIKDIAERLNVHHNTLLRARKAWGIYKEPPLFYKKIKETREFNKKNGIKPQGPTRFSILDPFIDEIVEMLQNGSKKSDVAKKYKVSVQTVFNALNRHNISIKTDNKVERLAENITELFENGLSYKEIAKKLNCSQQAVFLTTKKLKIQRNKEEIVIACKINKQEEKLIELFNKGLSHKEIAKELGCHAVSIGKYLNKIGLKRDFPNALYGKLDEIKEKLAQGLSQRQIAKELNICEKTLSYHIKKKGLKRA